MSRASIRPSSLTAAGVFALGAACQGSVPSAPTKVRSDDLQTIARPDPADPVEACQQGIGTFDPALAPLVRALCVDVAQRDIPGAVVAVSRRGGPPAFIVHGDACAGGPSTTVDTVFRVGSVTKSLVALAALSSGGSIDDPAHQRLPALATRHPDVTLRDLLVHTSGLPDIPESEPRDLVEVLAMREAWVPPGRVWAYSNSGVGLAYRALARPDRSAADAVRAAIDASKLEDVWFQLEPPTDRRAACAHAKVGDTLTATPLGLDLPLTPDAEHWSMAAGGAIASARGLLELARHLARVSSGDGLDRPAFEDGTGRGWTITGRVVRYGDGRVWGTRGDTGSASTEIRWDGDGNVIVALSNTGGGLPTTMHAAVEELFGLDPTLRRRPDPIPPGRLPGTYGVGGWGDPVVVRADGDRLRLDIPALGSRNLALEPDSMPNTWNLERPLAPAAIVTFIRADEAIYVRGPGFVGQLRPG